ncbi:MAG TPA: orotidine-5'-phosphate decarboxylase [Candidatus Woesebacteria bacterium]|nr:orotidine-5'-phosphate decarboxylase [Candidatus Woesebacteria bacterium]
MTFQQKLDSSIEKNNSLLCVGLDADIEKLPQQFKNSNFPQFTFNKWIIDETAPFVCAFKPNTAFYEARGIRGIEELKLTCDYIRTTFPDLLIILDAKRGDIGNTNNGYVEFAFNYLQADAITLHPYLGAEALTPFFERIDKGSIILCRTSNEGATEFQDLLVDKKPLYEVIANKVITEWNQNNNCLLVVGATYPEDMKQIRTLSDEMTFLVPGIGAQGGDLEKTMKAGLNSEKKGMIINAGRSIIFAKDPKEEAEQLQKKINSFRN